MIEQPSSRVAVAATNLSVIRHGQAILDNVSCTIPAGKCTAILGPNGCGKTTFTRAITGMTFISEGSATVLGQTIGQTDVRSLRKRIGMVNPTVDVGGVHSGGSVVDADLTAHEAILTGFFGSVGLYEKPTKEQIDHADHLLKQVGLLNKRDLRYGLLSTGQQRRVMIARALVHLPELLILDEPTAGLDIRGREQVLATVEMLLARPDAPTVLLITHHVEEISPRTVQVMLMREGRFVHVGPPKQVITPETLSKTFDCKVFVKRIHGRWWLEVLPEAWVELISDV